MLIKYLIRRLAATLRLASALAAVGTVALGADAGIGEPPLASPEEAPAGIEEIVVTATKREEAVRDIAGTIAAMRGEELEEMGVQGVTDIVRLTPGVTITEDGINPKRVTIRGVASDELTNLTTGVLIGDVPFSDPWLPRVALDPNPFDLASVEILKGPQGTLFGGSALNGTIRYVPNPPVFGEWQAKYFTQFTSVAHGGADWTYGAALNAPFRDWAAVRIVGFIREEPGYVDDLGRGLDDVDSISQDGIRAIAAVKPLDRFTASFMAIHQATDNNDASFTDNFDGRLERSNTPAPVFTANDYTLLNLSLEYAFDWASAVSQTSTTEKNFDADADLSRAVDPSRRTLSAVVDNTSDAIVQELRLVSNDERGGPWRWLIGGFGFWSDLFEFLDTPLHTAGPFPVTGTQLEGVAGNVPLPLPGARGFVTGDGLLNVANFVADIHVRELALFGELTRTLFDVVDATVGMRLYSLQSGGKTMSSGLLTSGSGVQQGRLEPLVDDVIEEKGVNPKFALKWRPLDGFMWYASVARGFRFGGIQILGDTPTEEVPPVFKSDILWSYETGLRTEWLDRRVLFDATGYYIDWDSPQVQQYKTDTTNYIDNVGHARGHGTEISLEVLPPLDGLSLGLIAAWAVLRTTEPYDSSKGELVPVGQDWPLTPRWQTATTLSYERSIGGWLASGTFRHGYIAKAFNRIEANYEVFGYQSEDLLFGVKYESIPWLPSLSLSVTNLTDTTAFSNINDTDLYNDIMYVRPRTIVLRLAGEF